MVNFVWRTLNVLKKEHFMKNSVKLLEAMRSIAITAIVAVIGFSMTACDNDPKPAHVHQWEWVETTPATPTAEGLETETCKTCRATNGTRIIEQTEPTVKEFSINFDYFDSINPCGVLIQDARTACGSATLEQLGIVEQIENAIEGAYSTAVFEQFYFIRVFREREGTTIIVENTTVLYKLKATDKSTMYLHIDYLKSNPSDIQQEIIYAVSAMYKGGASLPYNADHLYSTTWSYDLTQHWHECTANDGAKTDVANHDWNTETRLCNSDCGALYYELGDTGPGGGKIFYVSTTGFTVQMVNSAQNYTAYYLEAAPDDMETTLAWASTAPTDYSETDIPDTDIERSVIGPGRKNTALILAIDANAPAAKACNDYSNNGKTDWFLPSLGELKQLFENSTSVGNLKMTVDNVNYTHNYWSSSQYLNNMGDVWCLSGWHSQTKGVAYSVRAVRAF
jgi:hypothetical protein